MKSSIFPSILFLCRTSFCLLSIFLSSVSNHYAQILVAREDRGSNRIGLEVIEDNPNTIANQYYGLDYLGFDMNKHMAMGFGLDMNYFYQNRIWLKANIFRVFAPGTDSERGDYYRGERKRGYTLPVFQKIDIGTTVYFAEIKSRPSKKILIKESALGRGSIRYFLKTRINTTTRFGVRTGYYGYRTSVRVSFEVDTIASNRPIRLNGYSSDAVYGGLSISGFQNLVLKSDYLGMCGRSVVYHFYADALFSFRGNEFFNAYDETIMRSAGYDYNNDFSWNNVGFRIGLERIRRHQAPNKLGLKFALETGVRPTPQILAINPEHAPYEISGFYFSLKAGINLVKG